MLFQISKRRIKNTKYKAQLNSRERVHWERMGSEQLNAYFSTCCFYPNSCCVWISRCGGVLVTAFYIAILIYRMPNQTFLFKLKYQA